MDARSVNGVDGFNGQIPLAVYLDQKNADAVTVSPIFADQGDYGVDITHDECKDEECIRTKYVLWEGDANKVDPERSIEILRLETNTLDFNKHHVSYFIMEVCRGEKKLSQDDLFHDNLNLDNRPTVKHMFYHIKALYDYSSQQKLLNKLRKQREEDYKNFTENF